jgi:hypothetical protein
MQLTPQRISAKDKLILAGLYFSQFDLSGLKKLGFKSFQEAFNTFGYALGSRPASVKNYRDEFDPLFLNKRQGWHKRPRREYCIEIYKKYKDLNIEEFSALLKSFVGYDENVVSGIEETENKTDGESFFAKRLVTGMAAEHYFEAVQPHLAEFRDYDLENTTRLGCGYDFRLHRKKGSNFIAVEVKGLQERNGSVSLTPKEYDTASTLTDRYFLFVVRNFRKTPSHDIYCNPLSGSLRFVRKERVVVQISWLANV